MQVVRTVTWIVVTIILVAFIAMNWGKAPVNFWPLEDGYLHFEWPVGVIALMFFILGVLPMWLMLRATRWRLNRRINALENSLRAAAAVTPVPPPPGSESLPETTPDEPPPAELAPAEPAPAEPTPAESAPAEPTNQSGSDEAKT